MKFYLTTLKYITMETVPDYLKAHKGKQGLYMIRPKNQDLMALLCEKLNYNYSSEVAYIGKDKNESILILVMPVMISN
ncbi:MAG: hypothetical protein ACI9EK_002952 [Psychroserpens sp.]|jgi:hypothetical protein